MAIDVSILNEFADFLEKRSTMNPAGQNTDNATTQQLNDPSAQSADHVMVNPVVSGQGISRSVPTNNPIYGNPKPATQPGKKLKAEF